MTVEPSRHSLIPGLPGIRTLSCTGLQSLANPEAPSPGDYKDPVNLGVAIARGPKGMTRFHADIWPLEALPVSIIWAPGMLMTQWSEQSWAGISTGSAHPIQEDMQPWAPVHWQ